MDTSEPGSTGGESSPYVYKRFCNCSQAILTSFECVCPGLSSLTHVEDRQFLSQHLSLFPEITDFRVSCKQKSSTNTSGLFGFLPASVKKLMLFDCFQQYIGKEVFYGIPYVEDLTIENLNLTQLGLDVTKTSFTPNIDLSYNNVESLDISSLQILGIAGKTVRVDLSHNNLRILYNTDSSPYSSPDVASLSLILDLRWNKFTSLPFFLATHESFSRSRIAIAKALGLTLGDISLKMTENPLVCDCGLYELMSNLDVAKQGALYTKTDFQHMECAFPDITMRDDISNVTTILHLEGNHLTVINQTVLPQLLMIRELYLNDNNISNIDDMSFNNFISLAILRLDGNNISEINSKVFKSLSELRELYLNNSGVKYLTADTFQDLAKLQKLHLENNKLKSLPENMFSVLKKLTLLGIHGNPLTCGCDVLWFANWLRSRAYLLPQGRNVSCVASTKVTRNILSLSAAQFDCEDLQAAQARTRRTIGLSIALVLVTIVLVCVIVVVKRKEDIQVYLYARYGWRFREEKEDEDKEYDAFLSYSQHDLDVVLQDVLPALENREPPFRVCLHHRDFLPGVPIAENILNAVSASKRTIILLSNNFLESDWCQLEFQAAHAQMLQDRANRVIVILLDDIPAENAPVDIQHYLKTNTYLKWGDERFWERLIYAMPRPRPHAQNEDGDQLAMVELDHNG
ncbi:TIR domain [Branchiostoma belcheri]|nr:TIR domain [Branchiostoma belcheri]